MYVEDVRPEVQGDSAKFTRPPKWRVKLKGQEKSWPFNLTPGNDLLSHRVTPAVSSAREGLTAVFGMGTGVSPPPWSPENRLTPVSSQQFKYEADAR